MWKFLKSVFSSQKQKDKPKYSLKKKVFLCLLCIATFWLGYVGFFSSEPKTEPELKNLAELEVDLAKKEVDSVVSSPNKLHVVRKDKTEYDVQDQGYLITSYLLGKNKSEAKPLPFTLSIKKEPMTEERFSIMGTLSNILFIAFIFVLLISIIPFDNFKSRNRKGGIKITFDDVIGQKEAKSSLQDVIQYFKDPEQFKRLGAVLPGGVIMTGGPGLGKTMLAKALAGESGVNFLTVTGGDFSSKFYGVGIRKIKSLFKTARKMAPCVIFIDEIDGLGRRSDDGNAAQTEHNRMINQFLAEMDGFDNSGDIFIVGATNNLDAIDEALLREGRFDRKIHLSMPTYEDRLQGFSLYSKNIVLDEQVDFKALSRNSIGFSLAKIKAVINQAALIAAREKASVVSNKHIMTAIETIRMGEAKPNELMLNDELKKRIAYHEAGHAVLGYKLNVGNFEMVSIIPRGQALGVTVITPLDEMVLHTETELKNRILMLLAGRNVEKKFWGNFSTGASNDLKEASRIAYSMTAIYGMGGSTEENNEPNLFSVEALGNQAGILIRHKANEAENILRQLSDECFALINCYESAIVRVAQLLLDKETISKNEFEQLMLLDDPAKAA